MKSISNRFNYLFRSTKGLALVAFAVVSIVVAIWGTLSGPLADFGVKDITVRVLGMDLVPAEREGRLITLYHSIAMAVVAVQVYFITHVMPMKEREHININATVTVGYLLSLIFGLLYGYFGHNRIFHGLFLVGLSLMFYGGIQLSVALWPWRKEHYIADPKSEYSHTKRGVNLERVAFFSMSVATLGSSIFGAVAGASYGAGFVTFLAEDTLRDPHKSSLDLAVIGHLHIMVALVGVAAALIIGRWLDFKGILHKIAMPFMIFGTIVLSIGVWLVVPFEFIAHIIIYVGSSFVLFAGLFLFIFSWQKITKDRLAEQGITKASFGQKVKALLHDPLKFGATWQMLYMNFTTTFVGIFMAARLDKIIRRWPLRDERVTLSGHWHALSTIIATIMLFYFADMMGLKGKARKWFGWLTLIFSDIAFGASTVFALKRLFVSESAQQPMVDVLDLLIEGGLGIVLVTLAAFMIWRLVDLLQKDGGWSKDTSEAEL